MKTATAIDAMANFSLKLSGLLCIALVLLTTEQVLARYAFNASSIALQELEWHLFGAIFLLAGAATFQRDGHVRVDVFYGRMTPRQQAVINLWGTIFFAIPALALIIWFGVASVMDALSFTTHGDDGGVMDFVLRGERSPDPGGLRARWIIKSMIPLGALLLLGQVLGKIPTYFKLMQRSNPDA
jgi:TRAP-type mannitol/chloroaromatic compound transport system permease small subunit